MQHEPVTMLDLKRFQLRQVLLLFDILIVREPKMFESRRESWNINVIRSSDCEPLCC